MTFFWTDPDHFNGTLVRNHWENTFVGVQQSGCQDRNVFIKKQRDDSFRDSCLSGIVLLSFQWFDGNIKVIKRWGIDDTKQHTFHTEWAGYKNLKWDIWVDLKSFKLNWTNSAFSVRFVIQNVPNEMSVRCQITVDWGFCEDLIFLIKKVLWTSDKTVKLIRFSVACISSIIICCSHFSERQRKKNRLTFISSLSVSDCDKLRNHIH